MNNIQIDMKHVFQRKHFHQLIPKKYRHRDHPSHPLNFTAKSWKRRGRGEKEPFFSGNQRNHGPSSTVSNNIH